MREDIFRRKDGEGDNEYITRMYKIKSNYNLTNKDVAIKINEELGTSYAESTLRSVYKYFSDGFEVGYDRALNKVKNNKMNEVKTKTENYDQIKSYKETVEINKDGSYTLDRLIGVEDETKLRDENYLLKCHGYDPKLWQIVSARNSKWNIQKRGGDIGKLYASKINIKPRVDNISILELKEHYDEFSRSYNDNFDKYSNFKVEEDGKLLVLPVYDFHFGKKSYAFETGNDMDYEKLEERYLLTLMDILDQVKHIKFQKILYPIGSDMFNTDTISNSTTAGTSQDNSLRWQEMFKKGLECVIKGVDMISEELKAPIELFYVMGNHDTQTSYHALLYLSAWYRGNSNVYVDESALARKYYEFGKCLLGFTHGDKEGKRIFNLMQVEKPEEWGRTKYREWYTGHLHTDIVRENGGVKVRTVSTICGTDAWHYLSGYVGNVECIQAYVWDKDRGLRNIVHGVYY